MGKVILKGKDSITVNLGRFELAVFVEGWCNTIQSLYDAEDQDLNQIMLLLTAIEPFIEYATPETKTYLNEIKEEILNPVESTDEELPEAYADSDELIEPNEEINDEIIEEGDNEEN